MEPMTRRSHPLSRQEIKEIMRMPVPIFRKWIMTYSMTVYNLGVDDCKEILHDEFGFGEKRMQRFIFVCARKRPRNSSKGRNNATMTNVCCSNGWNRDLDVFRVTTKESCAGKRDLSITD